MRMRVETGGVWGSRDAQRVKEQKSRRSMRIRGVEEHGKQGSRGVGEAEAEKQRSREVGEVEGHRRQRSGG